MKRVDREGPVQRAIVRYLAAQYPSWMVNHCRGEINKGGKQFMIELSQAKVKGAKAGFPDLIVLPPMPIGPMFFEVKAEGNYASAVQKVVHAELKALGYRVAVVRSIDDVKECIAAWISAGSGLVELRGQVS